MLQTFLKITIATFLSLVAFFVSAIEKTSEANHTNWYEKNFEVMGTAARVEFESNSPKQAQHLILSVMEEMRRIDFLMSPYKPESELSKINQFAAKYSVEISEEMYRLLVKSKKYYHLTKGAFDITFSSVGYLYDYRNHSKPTEQQTKALTPFINYDSVELNENPFRVSFKSDKTKIDLGGIAKGHAVDRCINILKQNGITNAFVSAGGDSRVIGKKNGRYWYIGIKHPREENRLVVNMPVAESAISTSGDYERYFKLDGKRYHHIINPKTGESAKHTQSTTILADYSTDADALSTSVFVLGPIKGMELINAIEGVSAIIIDENGEMTYSNDLVGTQ